MNPIGKRILGIVLLGVGIWIAVWLKGIHDSGGNFPEKAMIFMPLLILYGGLMAIAPDTILARGEWTHATAAKKAINIVVTLVGVGIGLFLRFVVFSGWK